LCGKSYNDADALSRHLRQHKTLERYRCIECEITVNRKDNMLRHLRSMHPGCAFESTVEIVTARSNAQEITPVVPVEERPPTIVRYNSVIQSVGNVEPVVVPEMLPLPTPLRDLHLEQPLLQLEQPILQLEQPLLQLEQPLLELEQPLLELQQPPGRDGTWCAHSCP